MFDFVLTTIIIVWSFAGFIYFDEYVESKEKDIENRDYNVLSLVFYLFVSGPLSWAFAVVGLIFFAYECFTNKDKK